MENFFYEDNFYTELCELCEYQDWDKEYIQTLPEDYTIEVMLTDAEPIFKLDAEWITERIDEERFSENNCDDEYSRITKILNENIDFEKINALIPQLYYGNRAIYHFTKQDLLDAVS